MSKSKSPETLAEVRPECPEKKKAPVFTPRLHSVRLSNDLGRSGTTPCDGKNYTQFHSGRQGAMVWCFYTPPDEARRAEDGRAVAFAFLGVTNG